MVELIRSIQKSPVPRIALTSLALLICLALIPLSQLSIAESEIPNPEYLKVIGSVPDRGDWFDGNLTLFFESAILVPDEIISEPFKLDPPHEATFRIGKNFISMKITKWQPGQLLKVKLNDQIRSADGKGLQPGHKKISFLRSNFGPDNIWEVESTTDSKTIGIHFPATVNPEEFSKHLSVKNREGETLDYTVLKEESSSFFNVKVNSKTWPVNVTVQKDLKDESDWLIQKKSWESWFPLPGVLYVNSVRWDEVSMDKKTAKIVFSDSVSTQSLIQNLEIKQKGSLVKFEPISSQQDGLSYILQLSFKDTQNINLDFNFSKGLGNHNAVLKGNQKYSLTHIQSELRIRQIRWGTNWSNGDLICYLSFNHRIDREDLRKHLQLDPPLESIQISHYYGSQYKLTGDWFSNQPYQITIKPGLKHKGGIDLTAPLTRRTVSLKNSPQFAFQLPNKFYLPRTGKKEIPIKHRYVSKINLKVYRMFPSNVAMALKDFNGKNPGYGFNQNWCELINESTKSLENYSEKSIQDSFKIDEIIPENNHGLFCLEASGDAGRYTKDQQFILLTQLGSIAHWQSEELALFVHDLQSLEPTPQAKVTIWSQKNQRLAEGETDNDGLVVFRNLQTKTLGAPGVAVIEKENDYTLLELKRRVTDTQDFTLPKLNYPNKNYEAFIYSDRTLYRPGETVHLHWTVRTNYSNAVADVPFLLKLFKPNGRLLLSRAITLSEFGTATFDWKSQADHATGRYRAEIFIPGSEKSIGKSTIQMEEFVPARMKAELELKDQVLVAGSKSEITVFGEHLFGAAASNRKCEATVKGIAGSWKPEKWEDYHFGNNTTQSKFSFAFGEKQLNPSGRATFDFHFRPAVNLTAPLLSNVTGSVYELGGRAVRARKKITLFPSDICLGIAADAADQPGLNLRVAAIKPDQGFASLDQVEVTLERLEWIYNVRRYYSHHEPSWTKKYETRETKTVNLNQAVGLVNFSVNDYGYYRVKVSSPSTKQFSTLSFYSNGGHCNIVNSKRPSLIKMELDKEEYSPGEIAKLRIDSPFNGRAIVAIQSDTIHRVVTVPIKDRVGSVNIPAEMKYFPNAWIQATVIHEVEGAREQVHPYSSFAVLNMLVRDEKRKLIVDIPNLPTEILPNKKQSFDILVRDHSGQPVVAEITLAAVDEGIHLLNDSKVPDPYDWMTRSRRSDFNRAHYYDKVAYDFEKPATGGDYGKRMSRSLAAPDSNWIKTVALWSSTVKTDDYGNAKIYFDVPEFNGQLRLVAVAMNQNAMGSVKKELLVRQPIMLRVSAPRFLLPQDTAQIHSTIFNHTSNECVAKINWKTEGSIKNTSDLKTFKLKSNSEEQFGFEIQASQIPGAGKITLDILVENSAGQKIEHIIRELDLPVRPPTVYQSQNEFASIKPGESRSFKNVTFIEDERAECEITVGANPLLRLQDSMRYCIKYPYGCLEQTTSKLMPLYLLRKSRDMLDLTLNEEQQVDTFLQAGIDRLFARQCSDGGLGYWSADRSYVYGSIYALHCLTLIKNGREHEIPEESFSALQSYVKGIAQNWNDNTLPSHYQRAYAVYVLSLDGDAEALRMIRSFDSIKLPHASRYLLAAALATNSNDPDRVEKYLQQHPSVLYRDQETDGNLNSHIRAVAVELLAMNAMSGKAEQKRLRAEELMDFLEVQLGSTQERAFAISAMAGYLDSLKKGNQNPSAIIINPEGYEQQVTSELLRVQHSGTGGDFTVTNNGDAEMYVNLSRSGVPLKINRSAISEGLKIKRHYFKDDGSEIVDGNFKQTGNYIVALEIEASKKLKNIILADLLPAGFEIENPRLHASNLPNIKFRSEIIPSHLELRDDRLIAAFNQLSKGTHRFYYTINAVTPGEFQLPSVTAECMYDARIRASSEFGKIVIAK